MKDNFIKDKTFIKALLNHALPICLQMIMFASVSAADAFMLGGIEQNSMAAVSLASQIQFVQNLVLSGTISTTALLGAQYWGKKDTNSIDDIFALSIRFTAFISFMFFVGCYFFPRQLMMLYTNEEVLIEIGVKYLRITAFAYLISGLTQSFITMTRISDHIKTAAIISCSAVVINIVLNSIFIFNFNMSAEGAALATVIARIIEFSLAVIMSYRPTYLRLKFNKLLSFNKLLTLDFLKCMFPLMGASLLWGIGFTSYTSFMGHLGTDAAAANSITAVIRDLICASSDGIAQGGGIMVGNELGSANLEKGKLYGKRMAKIAFILGAICSLLMMIVTPAAMRLVKLTPQAQYYLKQMMIVMSIYMIGRYVNTIVINGVLTAGGDTMYDMYSLFVTMWCIALPLAALGTYVFHWPVVVIYACTCLDEVGKIPWTMHHFSKYEWVKDLTR